MEGEKNSNQIVDKVSNKPDNINESDMDDHDNIENNKSSKFLKRGRIFIRNLPFSITEEKIKNLFSKYGEIKELNLPYDQNKKMFKGFCFLQYATKKEALVAIKELDGKLLDKRKLAISVAQPKNEYVPLPKVASTDFKIRSKSIDEKRSDKTKVKIENFEDDPSRTLFIRNLGFDTNEETLKGLFSKYGKIRYCLICKNKETNVSKGSGFIMFDNKDDIDNILRIYEKYESNKDYSGINPFELEGRNLKLFRALSKNEAEKNKEEKKNDKNDEDNRNRELLYYGLNNYYDFVLKENQVSEEDKARRENIILLKKTNFKKNPNLHVSETRLVLRNIDKNYDEKKIKELLRQQVENFMEDLKTRNSEELKIYKKLKKIKQIKLMRDDKVLDKENNPKSKCVAFVEVCDKNFGKWLINKLSNMDISKNKKKGIIMDFALDDIRKIRNRIIKLEKLKLYNKKNSDDNEEKGESKKKVKNSHLNKKAQDDSKLDKNKEEAQNKNQTESIDHITDIDKLAAIYNTTLSRGKKQRIKKRIKALGHPLSVLGKPKELNFSQINKSLVMNQNTYFNKDNSDNNLSLNEESKKKANEDEIFKKLKTDYNKNNESYTVIRVDNQNMNINKKIKEQIKKNKNNNNQGEKAPLSKNNNSLTGQKRNRSNEKKDHRSNAKISNPKKNNNSYNRVEEEEDEFEMSHYINQIEQNLKIK